MAQVATTNKLLDFVKMCQKLEYFVLYALKANPTTQQLEVIKAIDNGEKRISIKSGHGCFAKGTKVMLHNCDTKVVEDVKVGDILMGDDSTPRNVLELYRGRENMYRFTLNDGTVYEFNESHILCLVSTQTHGSQIAGDKITVTIRDWLKWSNRKKRTHAFYRKSLVKDEVNLEVEPYKLGAWLGDGASRGDKIYLGDKKNIVSKALDIDEIPTKRFNRIEVKRQRNNLHFGIKSVEFLGEGDYYGFELDGNHKFLGADFIVLHNTGKTGLLSWITLWAGLAKYDCKIPMTAPSAPQLLNIMIPEIRKWKSKLPEFMQTSVDVKVDKVSFSNNNFAVARTARKENPEAMQGFHATNLLFIVDEASGVPENIFEVIDGALTGVHNILIMTGNPTRTSGYFYNSFHKNRDLFKLFTFNAEDSPNVSKAVIERRQKEYGTDSDVYRVRVLGEFPRSSSDSLFAVADLEDAVAREAVDKSGAMVWGLDVARFGDDSSVLAKRKGYYLSQLITKENLSTMELASFVAYEYQSAKEKPKAIFIDSIGIGAGVYDRCIQLGLPVISANVSNRPSKDIYVNKRAEIYYEFSNNLKSMKLPNDDMLLGDLNATRFMYSEKGKLMIIPKADIKKELGRSPDRAEAVALTFFDIVVDKEFEMEEERLRESEHHLYSTYGGVW